MEPGLKKLKNWGKGHKTFSTTSNVEAAIQ